MSEKNINNHWADIEETGFFWGLKILAFIYNVAGRRACLIVMFPILLVFYLSLTSARSAVREFLNQISINKGSKSPGYWSGFRNFIAFGSAALDKLSAWNGDIKPSQISFPGNMTSLFDLDPEKKGAVLFVSHLGNVEVIRAMASVKQVRPVNVLVHTKHATRFNSLMERFNAKSQLKLIEVTEITPDVAMQLKECISRGEWVVIAADRPPVSERENIVLAPFLGRPAPFALGPYVLAHILEAPVYMVAALRRGSKFEIRWSKLGEKISLPRKKRREAAEIWAAKYAKWLEALALEHPNQWYNFFHFWTQPQD